MKPSEIIIIFLTIILSAFILIVEGIFIGVLILGIGAVLVVTVPLFLDYIDKKVR